MFTQQQAVRMTNALNSSVSARNNLSSPSNLTLTGISPVATCPPKANFIANKQVICVNQPVSYTDMSSISTPTAWSWNFQGGTPSTSSVQNPTVSYSSAGTYSVQLTASNGNGNTAEVKVNYITVIAAPVTSSLQEGFEGGAIPNNTWSVKNLAALNSNWQQTSAAASSGSKSARVNQSIEAGTTVELYSPSYNFAGMPGVAMTMKWAGSERNTSTTSSYDVFSVQISTNCGQSWLPRITRNIKTGSVGVSPSVTNNFIPDPTQFYMENINVAGFVNEPNVMFKFKFTAETGSSNNFYIDDINITSATGVVEIPLVSNIQVFPNPATDRITIEFDLTDNKEIEMGVKDVLGRTVKTGAKENLVAGHHRVQLPLTDLAKGVYFVSIRSNAQTVTKKIIVE